MKKEGQPRRVKVEATTVEETVRRTVTSKKTAVGESMSNVPNTATAIGSGKNVVKPETRDIGLGTREPLFRSNKSGNVIDDKTARQWLKKLNREERQRAKEAKKEDGSTLKGGEKTMEKERKNRRQLAGVQTEGKGNAGANAKEKRIFAYTKKQKIATVGIAALFAAAGVGALAYHEATEHSGGKDSLAVTGGIHTMQMGETYTVENGIVNGDVMAKVNGEWVRLYDNDPATGLQVEVLGKTEIKAPYGATVNTNLDPERMDSMLAQAREVTQRANPEIKEIETVVISNGKIQGR